MVILLLWASIIGYFVDSTNKHQYMQETEKIHIWTKHLKVYFRHNNRDEFTKENLYIFLIILSSGAKCVIVVTKMIGHFTST